MTMPNTLNSSTHLRSRSEHISALRKLPTGTTNVLSRLHLRPETEWKSTKILVKFLRFFSLRSTIAERSSAKISALASPFAQVIPVKCLVYLILRAKISTLSRKMQGEMTSPWGTPCSKRIFLDRCPPSRIVASLLLKKKTNPFSESHRIRRF